MLFRSHREGRAEFAIGTAFYRAQSQMGRDLALLAAVVYRQQHGELRVLDAMTGCGVRPLRYGLEAKADWVWANEANPDLQPLLTQNLAQGLPPSTYRVTCQDANEVFFSCYQQRDFYDMVDVDCFGSGAPYLSTALWATRIGGLLYLTSTDTRTTGGHNPEHSVQMYDAYARPHPAGHEQGVRLLIGSIVQQAASQGLAIQPIFSFYNGHVHRVMVRLANAKPWRGDQYGFLGYCHHCGHYQTLSWRQLGRAICPEGGSDKPIPLVVSGPIWLGPLHSRAFLAAMAHQAQRWEWSQHQDLIALMQAEADLPPYYFTLPEVGRHGQMDIPKREDLMRLLRDRGFRVSLTHFEPQAIKTDATMADCVAAARSCRAESVN